VNSVNKKLNSSIQFKKKLLNFEKDLVTASKKGKNELIKLSDRY
jgi:hypothetical protein